MATAALNRYTPEEYLALERHAEFRSEYLNGRIIAMAGGSPEHADVVLNIGSELRARLRPRGCRVFVNDVRVRIASPTGYVYPAVVAMCAQALFLDTRPRTLLNPQLVVEVLSDTTEPYDRVEKFEAYRAIDSLLEYVLVDSRRVRVERYARQGDFWVFSSESDPDAVIELSSVGDSLSLREIYADVEFPGSSVEDE
ncbi:MAG: Uma2 family endonuclease [Gemmatimonadetes bacterium]|nr:Uma2 family endonuclease [Gemmatimonadota bacterium]